MSVCYARDDGRGGCVMNVGPINQSRRREAVEVIFFPRPSITWRFVSSIRIPPSRTIYFYNTARNSLKNRISCNMAEAVVERAMRHGAPVLRERRTNTLSRKAWRPGQGRDAWWSEVAAALRDTVKRWFETSAIEVPLRLAGARRAESMYRRASWWNGRAVLRIEFAGIVPDAAVPMRAHFGWRLRWC